MTGKLKCILISCHCCTHYTVAKFYHTNTQCCDCSLLHLYQEAFCHFDIHIGSVHVHVHIRTTGFLKTDLCVLCCRADITAVLLISARDGESKVCNGLS